jgi:hypothetical protein
VGRVNCSRPEGLVLHYLQVMTHLGLPLRARAWPAAGRALRRLQLSRGHASLCNGQLAIVSISMR